MKILVLADVHGDLESLVNVLDKIKIDDIDLVIAPGDFTDMFNIPKEFDQMDMAEIILQKIIALNKPLFCVPGNHDPYEILDLLEDYDIDLHGRMKEFKGTKIIGFGGAATPFNSNFEPSEEEIKVHLDRLEKKIENGKFILIVHNPPLNTKVDKIEEGKHVGSKVIREFIERTQPRLVISSHIHESEGEDKIKSSVIFYPGPIYEGKYGIVTIDDKTVRCEMKKVN